MKGIYLGERIFIKKAFLAHLLPYTIIYFYLEIDQRFTPPEF